MAKPTANDLRLCFLEQIAKCAPEIVIDLFGAASIDEWLLKWSLNAKWIREHAESILADRPASRPGKTVNEQAALGIWKKYCATLRSLSASLDKAAKKFRHSFTDEKLDVRKAETHCCWLAQYLAGKPQDEIGDDVDQRNVGEAIRKMAKQLGLRLPQRKGKRRPK